MNILLMKSKDVFVNVASSDVVLEGYINYDFHPLLPFSKLPIPAGLFLKYASHIQRFRTASQVADIKFQNCKRALPHAKGSVSHILCSHFLEHNYIDEVRIVLKNFNRVLKVGGTLHIVVPDLDVYVDEYIEARTSDSDAALKFCTSTILALGKSPTLLNRFLSFIGVFGLKHDIMFNRSLLEKEILNAGFEVATRESTPSAEYQLDDGSLHFFARKL